jgi:hypothetical protein
VGDATNQGISALLHPDWTQLDGCVLRRDVANPKSVRGWLNSDGGSVARTEWVLNHVHLWDELDEADDPHDDALLEQAERIATAWRESLSTAFPSRTFIVEVRAPDEDYGPTIYAYSA